ncbi:MAG: type II toxin-antitoxin system RelE/ParE family toxin [bacterium]|nr:type II toxin-antitoxin system RelE/ParE family toxin [bacterium]
MQVFYTEKAAKQLAALPKLIQKRIAQKMRFYVSQNNLLKFAEKLTDYYEGEYRFRIGDYRVIFDVDKDKIIILKIGHRKDVYI